MAIKQINDRIFTLRSKVP